MIIITTDVHCDRCSNWCAEIAVIDGEKRARKARKEARQYGWIQIKAGGRLLDLCPDCAAEHEAQSKGGLK